MTGSLVDAKNLAGKLGTALAVVGLLSAFLIASLLTLSSVAKRVRELGTLKALGWSQWLVVRQVSGEALVQGLLGGILGVLLGLAGAAAISAFGPELRATFETAQTTLPRIGPFGQGATPAASTDVSLDAPVSSLARRARRRPRAARRADRRRRRRAPRRAPPSRRCPPPPRLSQERR